MVIPHDFKSIANRGTRAGSTTLILTRDLGCHTSGWLVDPAHERCWHLSISCDDHTERDAWLRAIFGEHVDAPWGEHSVSVFGRANDVWHWRLFCDERWNPVVANAADLLATGMRCASDLGVAIVQPELAA